MSKKWTQPEIDAVFLELKPLYGFIAIIRELAVMVLNAREEATELRAERDQAMNVCSLQADDIAELRAELQKKTCCKGCPDCMPMGWKHEITETRRERDEARAERDKAFELAKVRIREWKEAYFEILKEAAHRK